MSHRGLAALTLLLLATATACGEPVATPEPVLVSAAGSTAMAPLVDELAAAFSALSPRISLEVSGLGTGFGLEALRAGEVDLALASWLPTDMNPDWQTTAIARDGIAIVVHPGNPVDGLGLLQLQDLFSGRIYEWAAAGGRATQGLAQPVSREAGSGTRAAFEALAMSGQTVTPRAVVAISSQGVIDYVAAHADAIGYVSMAFVTPEVKVLRVEGEQPTPETVERGSYPLTRELWLVTSGPPAESVLDFLRFVLSPAGQQLVRRQYGRIQ